MLWLCVHLPHLGLDERARLTPEAHLALVERQGGRVIVLDADESSRDLGVQNGMPLAAAYSLVSNLKAVTRDPSMEEAALKRLGVWALQFTSRVCLIQPQRLLLEVGGSLRLFGGARSLYRQISEGVAGLGYRHVMAMAPTPLAAEWLAVSGSGSCLKTDDLRCQLEPLPVHVLGLPKVQIQAMTAMGITRLAQLFRLPGAALGRRFGPTLKVQLEQALGQRADPRPALQPPDRFMASLPLAAEVDQAPALLFPLRRLLEEMCGFLRGRDGAVQRIQLQLRPARGAIQTVDLHLLAPSRDSGHWLEMMQQRLERLVLAQPVIELALWAGHLLPFTPERTGLFDLDGNLHHNPAPLLERLRARLGEDAVHGVDGLADHRPERAWALCPPGQGSAEVISKNHNRPLWLLGQPQRLDSSQGLPVVGRTLRLCAGPERIETGWWDNGEIARDYYLGIDAEGARLWVYRDRYSGYWFLHGYFA